MPNQDDSFLQLYTPIMPTPPCISARQFPPLDQQDSETVAVTSLSPPPRRGPKQMLESDWISLKNLTYLPREEPPNTFNQRNYLLGSPPLSSNNSNPHFLPDVSEKITAADEWAFAEDSSGGETQLTSFLDSEHDESSSRPSSIISQGFLSF